MNYHLCKPMHKLRSAATIRAFYTKYCADKYTPIVDDMERVRTLMSIYSSMYL